jgi:hypothetical protein
VRFDATVKLAVSAVDEIASDLITQCIDHVSAIAKDLDAFAMIEESIERFLRFLPRDVEASAGWLNGRDVDALTAALEDFVSSPDHLWRQLERHRFVFTVPFPPGDAHFVKDPHPSDVVDDKSSKRIWKGGRPPADWWDDLWIEICRQLFTGDLKPAKQAHVENAMKTWAAQNGHDVGDSSIRPRARKLFSAITSKDRN